MGGTRYSGTYPDGYGGSYPSDYCASFSPLITWNTDPRETWSVNETFGAADSSAIVRVRRSGDNAERDWGTVGGYLDAVSMLDWVKQSGADPTANGFTTKVYGSKGLYDFVQTTATKQPKIVNGGSLVTTASAKAIAMLFDGVDDVLEIADSCGFSGASDIVVLDYGSLSGTFKTCWLFGTEAAGQRLTRAAWDVNTHMAATINGANRVFNCTASSGEFAWSTYLASGAGIGTAVMRQDGSVLTQASVSNGSNTLSFGTANSRWGSDTSTGFCSGRAVSMAVFALVANAAADSALYEAHCAANY